MIQVSEIPDALTKAPQWLNWREETRAGKPTKVPVNSRTGELASTTNPSTWSTFDIAVKRSKLKREGSGGIGFAFDGVHTGIDFDHCRNPETGEIDPVVRNIVARLNSYTEVSPSGAGVHVIVKGELPIGVRNRCMLGTIGVEMYSRGRYFTVTGQRVEGTPANVESRQAELNAIHAELFPPEPKIKAKLTGPPIPRPTENDEERLSRARTAKNGHEFSRLYDHGDISDYDGDDSRADLALCNHLAFWTACDPAWMDQLFRKSALFREKWDRADYRERTIETAIRNTTDTYKEPVPTVSRNRLAVEMTPSAANELELATVGAEAEVTDVMRAAGLTTEDLRENPSRSVVEARLRKLSERLQGCDQLRRATVKGEAIDLLKKAGVSNPAEMVRAALVEESGVKESASPFKAFFEDPEPWPTSMPTSELLKNIAGTIKRFVVLPQGGALIVALWVVFTFCIDAFRIAPLLVITSPEKRCGKTTLLDLIMRLVRRPVPAVNITPAALFRVIEKYSPTLLLDEADTQSLGPTGENDELRGCINSGHRRDMAQIVRTVGEDHEPAVFSTWCPKAIALIGKLHETLRDRSIEIAMRRKSASEQVERFSVTTELEAELSTLQRQAFRWASDNIDLLRQVECEPPEELNDRARDNWRPLFAIAHLAGPQWIQQARLAALSAHAIEEDESTPVLLLSDIRNLFGEERTDRLFSSQLIAGLKAIEEHPWADWSRGKGLSASQLAKMLKPFGIAPGSIRVGPDVGKGYHLDQFQDAFSRYLPEVKPADLETRQTSTKSFANTPKSVTEESF